MILIDNSIKMAILSVTEIETSYGEGDNENELVELTK